MIWLLPIEYLFFLLLFIFSLFILENLSRRKAKYHFNSKVDLNKKKKENY